MGELIQIGPDHRPWQQEAWEGQQRFNILVVHRRAGKTVYAIKWLIKQTLACELPNPRGAYLAPLYRQAKQIAWQYIKDFFDCDDFAFIFRAQFLLHTGATNCGCVFSFSGAHDYCFFVFADSTIWMYEPQNDRWWDSGEVVEGDMYSFTSAAFSDEPFNYTVLLMQSIKTVHVKS